MRWAGFLTFLYVMAFFVFGAAVNATEQLTRAAVIASGYSLVVGGLVVLLRRKRVPPAARTWGWVAVVSAAAGPLALGGGAAWFLEHPHLVVYPAAACEQIKQAHVEAATGAPVECRFKAHLFRAQGGVGWYAYGVSENVRARCIFLSNELVDPRTLETDTSASRLSEFPEACASELGDVLALHPALQW